MVPPNYYLFYVFLFFSCFALVSFVLDLLTLVPVVLNVLFLSATQNVVKCAFTLRIEVLTEDSYCFSVYVFVAIYIAHYSQVLVHSTVVNSRNSLRYIPTIALFMQICKFLRPVNLKLR